jgi:hypothetical protein
MLKLKNIANLAKISSFFVPNGEKQTDKNSSGSQGSKLF